VINRMFCGQKGAEL